MGKVRPSGFTQLDFSAIVSAVSGRAGSEVFSQHWNPPRSRARLYKKRIPTENQRKWQIVFRELDLLWQGFSIQLKIKWNVIGARRKAIGYWIFMHYNLLYRKPPLTPVTDPDVIPDGSPPV